MHKYPAQIKMKTRKWIKAAAMLAQLGLAIGIFILDINMLQSKELGSEGLDKLHEFMFFGGALFCVVTIAAGFLMTLLTLQRKENTKTSCNQQVRPYHSPFSSHSVSWEWQLYSQAG